MPVSSLDAPTLKIVGPTSTGPCNLAVAYADANPTCDDVLVALTQIRQTGSRHVVTQAMTSEQARPFMQAGAYRRLELAVLELGDVHGASCDNAWRPRHLRPSMPWELKVAEQIDIDAFGDPDSFDRRALRDACLVTPRHRLVIARRDRTPVGFAICGAAQQRSMLQRLAVSPHYQRHGVGADLVRHCIHWASRQGAATMVVNTGIDNHQALGLYERHGFVRTTQSLCVLGFTL